jgi:uncharacterized protein (DUF488 family)
MCARELNRRAMALASPSFCYSDGVVVYTVGHSTLPLTNFLALLAAHGIQLVADVRQFPASRRHPQFGREALAAALADAGVGYVWLRALGGRRRTRDDSPHVAWRNPSFRGYADHMDGAEFAAGLAELLGHARDRPTAVLCAEAVPWRCHRQLISDALVARGVDVRHIVGTGEPSPHRLTPFARVEGTRVVYDGGQLGLPGAGPIVHNRAAR